MILKKSAALPDVSLHKQKRALLTRQEILRSARAVFAHDGFEHARIEDIASGAGKTRGAFYANFKDKEDVFFAIFEEDMKLDLAELSPLLLGLPERSQRVEAMGEYLGKLAKNRERVLLSLEFKLYAIRQPRKRKRLADLHAAMCLRTSIPEIRELLPHLMSKSPSAQLSDSLAVCGVMDGLALNHLFDPDTFDDSQLKRFMKLCLEESLRETSTAQSTGQPKRK